MQFIHTSAVSAASVTANSAYLAKDAISDRFSIPLAAGHHGALVENAMLIDYGSANGNMRLHLFHSQPSAYVPGVTFALANADDDKYLGYVDFTAWTSAGTSKMVAQTTAAGLGVYAQSGARNVWAVLEARENLTAGNVANPIRVKMTTRQDT